MIYESENYIAENIKYLKELAEKNGHKLVNRNEMIIGNKYYDPYCYVLIHGKKKNDYVKYYPEHYGLTYVVDVTQKSQ